MEEDVKQYIDSCIDTKLSTITYQVNTLKQSVDGFQESSKQDAVWRAKYGEKIENMGTGLSDMKKSIEKLSESIESLKDVPRKRYNGAINSFISAVIASIVTAIIALIGIKK